jgi:predicted porin
MISQCLQITRPLALLMPLLLLTLLAMAPWRLAIAQPTELTLYGIVDTGIGYTQTKGQVLIPSKPGTESRFGMSSGAQSGARWGMRVKESITADTSVIAVLESGLFSNTGELAQNGIAFGRQSTLGVESRSLGRVDFGLQTN